MNNAKLPDKIKLVAENYLTYNSDLVSYDKE